MTGSLRRRPQVSWPWWALCSLLLAASPAWAHFIDAQKGTLNFVGDGAFLVLSVPVSALRGIDDNGDRVLSKTELSAHAREIREQVDAGVRLRSPDGLLPLQLMMVDVETSGEASTTGARQVTILGRFQLRSSVGRADVERSKRSSTNTHDSLQMYFSLFGVAANERVQYLTVTRGEEAQWLRFTPEKTDHALLPSDVDVLISYMSIGMNHVLSGLDHLLFLMAVLAADLSLGGILGALTCFTIGHALTLVACIGGGWSIPAHIVEPAIAATIVTLTVFDLLNRHRDRLVLSLVRLELIFVCALIHGLGFASALAGFTQWSPSDPHTLWALAGFNLGIEIAQVGVAAIVCILAFFLRRFFRADLVLRTRQFATYATIAIGSIWFVQRIV